MKLINFFLTFSIHLIYITGLLKVIHCENNFYSLKATKHTLTSKFSNSFANKNKNKKASLKTLSRTNTNRRYLSEFREMQKNLEEKKKSFVLNENIEIKKYGAIFIQNGKFYLTNNKANNKGKIVAEINFHKTLFKKG